MTVASTSTASLLGVPRPEDELPHVMPDPSSELPYKDTWFISLRDDAADLSVAVHLTLSANRAPGLRTTVGLQYGHRSFLETRYTVPVRTEDSVGSDLATLRFVNPVWTPDKHLRLTIEHDVAGEPVRLDVDLRGRFFGADSSVVTPGLVPTSEGVQGLGHAEQALTMSGTLRWGDEEIAVSGPGYRDRSWGYRKSDKLATHGWAFAQAHLPVATCGLLAWRSSDAGATAPLPVGAWLADADGVRAATEGLLHLDASARLDRLALTFPDRTVELRTTALRAELHYPFHEPEMDGPALATACWDQHLIVDTGSGPGTAMVNIAFPFLADVLRHARFCHGEAAR